MTLKERIEICRFLNQVNGNQKYAQDIGIIDKTRFIRSNKLKSNSSKREKQ